jgi:uncharacterized protein (TIGR02147 family)
MAANNINTQQPDKSQGCQYTHIRDYLNVAEWLQAYYANRKQKQDWFSYRYWGNQIQLDAGYLLKVVQGKHKLPLRCCKTMAKFCGLNGQEQKYLEKLIHFEKASSATEIRSLFEELQQMRECSQLRIAEEAYSYFTHWYIPALRSLLEINPLGDDYRKIGQLLQPTVPAEQIKYAVGMLQRLGMITKNKQNQWSVTTKQLGTGDTWCSAAIEKHQEQLFALGTQSITQFPKEQRDVSTITFSVPSKRLQELQEMMRDFRKKVIQWVDENQDEDQIMQLNLQLFPLSVCMNTATKSQNNSTSHKKGTPHEK